MPSAFFKCFAIITSPVITLLLFNPACAQVFTLSDNGKYGHFDGAITTDSPAAFRAFVADSPALLGISLNSPGGTVVSALEMGNVISEHRFGTFIAEGDFCASACSILFFAGHDRLAKGQLGVHQMDDGGRASAATIQFVLADLLDAFDRFNVPWEISKQMLTTPADAMYWISPEMSVRYGLNRDLPGDASSTSVALSPPKVGASFKQFPTKVYLAGAPSAPDFSGRDKSFRGYRTRISEGVNGGANFAGHIAVVEVGCGTSCRFAFVVDLRTGEVASFPYGGEEQYEMALLYTVDSRLLKVVWADTSSYPYGPCIEQDLLIEGLEFRVLSERRFPRKDFCNG
ncbi:hypothetical protein SuNHUV7_26100 (plasmid) [Pseudoseohaeicola sp. NH-UV-7]|uniref:COG3904 family protein n=1 Tax=Sulfitobacter sp. TBRI5 TaxID=2989732 RepID=UPI003A6E5BFB